MEEYSLLRVLFSFGLVLGLIGMFALALRTLAQKNPGWAMQKTGGRLQVIETKMLDARRKLVLIKRDEQEHLLLLSPQGELLVEKIEGKANV